MEPPLIPRDQPATLAVNLSETGAYRLYVRGFNPTDERDGLPELSEFPQTITIATPQPAYPPPGPTGLFPRDGDVIGRTESVTRVHCRLHWDPLPGADRFLLYLAAADGTPAFDSSESPDLNLPAGPYFDFVNVRQGTTLDVDLRPGSYTWQVVGINDAGAAPDYGLWSEPRHFEIIPAPAPGAVPLSLERSGTTGLRLRWSPAGAFPELVEAWLWQGKRKGWLHYAPQGMTEVDGPARTGVIELPGLSRGRRQLVRLRGYALTSPGELTPGEVVEFPVPSVRESRRNAPGPR
jgi:hypothetical protein